MPPAAARAGIALRVPTPNVSVVDLVIQVEKKTFAEEVNSAFREAAAGAQKGVLAVSDLPLVSKDFALSDVSTTIDSSLTMVMVRAPGRPVAARRNPLGVVCVCLCAHVLRHSFHKDRCQHGQLSETWALPSASMLCYRIQGCWDDASSLPGVRAACLWLGSMCSLSVSSELAHSSVLGVKEFAAYQRLRLSLTVRGLMQCALICVWCIARRATTW